MSSIAKVYDRIASGCLTSEDIVPVQDKSPYDYREYIRRMYSTGSLEGLHPATEQHVADLQVFSHFRDTRAGSIIDIGANFGFSAVPIRRSGTPCPILSIEALDWHQQHLAEVKRLDANYDFYIGAVSDQRRELTFLMPVINGVPIDGLNSAAGAANFTANNRDWLLHNVASAEGSQFVFAECRISALPLDEILKHSFAIRTEPVAAIKIDVEGHEPEVLAGAIQTFDRDQPFVMIEGGMRNPDVATFFADRGYVYGDRVGDQLVLESGYSSDYLNGYWLHGGKLEQYRAMGLLI